MQTTLRISILSAVATACALSLSAHAADAPDFNKVVLYGDVTIAKDSTASWGVWEEIEPPSAGPSVSLTRIPSSNELYRPLGQVQAPVQAVPTTAAGLCASGALCGYGVLISTISAGESFTDPVYQAVVLSTQAATANGSVNVQEPAASWLLPAISLDVKTLNGDAIPGLTNTGPLTLNGSIYSNSSSDSSAVQDIVVVSTDVGNIKKNYGVDETVDPVTGYIVRYTQGQSEGQPVGQNVSQLSSGYWGITTSAQDMADLKRGQVIANYTGTNVSMNVNFGNGTFESSHNGGRDGQITFTTYSNGTTVLSGDVGVNAVGTISGSNFKSTSVSALDGQVSGTVAGSFFGTNAAVAAGVVDVVKTVSVPTPVNATAAATTSGSVVTYTNAQFVSSFVAVRNDLLDAKR